MSIEDQSPVQRDPDGSASFAQEPVRFPSIPPRVLFIEFSRMALSGFGGVMPFAYRALVERLQWVSAAEFAELIGLAQVLPGPNICNLALMVGWRKGGLAGAIVSLGGMLLGPMGVVICAAALYEHFQSIGPVRHALTGMAAVACGLILATAIKMAIALFGERKRRLPELTLMVALIVLAFVGVGVMQWPLIAVVATLAPLAIGYAYWSRA